MHTAPDILFALAGDVQTNSRALRQLRALAEAGYRVHVLSLGTSEASPGPGTSVRALPRPAGNGPAYFYRLHRLYRDVAAEVPARAYHASDLYVLPALAAAAQRHGGRLVYDARELYPHVASTVGRPWASAFWRYLEARYVRRADHVFTVSQRIALWMSLTYSIGPPDVLLNVPPQWRGHASGTLRTRAGLPDRTVVFLHQGQLRKDRGCFLLLDAWRDVSGAALVFLGDGPLLPAMMDMSHRLGLNDRVRFVPPVTPDQLLPVTADANVGITLLEGTCLNHRFALPNKLFQYVMAGLPVLGSNLSEIRNVVERYELGEVVDPTNRTALVDAIRRMASNAGARSMWSKNARRASETFRWENASQRLIGPYKLLFDVQPA